VAVVAQDYSSVVLPIITRAVIAVIAANALFAACTAPARQVELLDTSWTVTSVDGQAAIGSPPPTLTFRDDGRTFVLMTGCAAWVGEYGLDTDGDALSFGLEEATDDQPCTEEVGAQEEMLLEAVLTTERWTVRSQDQITFLGETSLQLERAR
jgi:heat shock protein HslJ